MMPLRCLATSLWTLAVLVVAAAPTASHGDEAPYQLGRGVRISDGLTMGGYLSTEYTADDRAKTIIVDDLALLAYGRARNLSYLLELESVDFARYDFEADTGDWVTVPAIERLYADYSFSDVLGLRVGKQITPIGYWNLQPINVLRETTSNPTLSRDLFPKFVTGLDVFGFAPFAESLSYHLYLQGTRDLDDEYINIPIDRHFGGGLEKEFPAAGSAGGSLGYYRRTDGTAVRYLQLNFKRLFDRTQLQGEANVATVQPPAGTADRTGAAYLQVEYRLARKHLVVSRTEYYLRPGSGADTWTQVMGYGYRPRYPISFKGEYQWQSGSAPSRVLASFSVLF